MKIIGIIVVVIIVGIICLFKWNRKPQWYVPEDPTPREQCPCCDYISLPERGNFLICKICFWEDDGQDIDELDVSSGPNNGITLREARKNFKTFGAGEREMLQYVLPVEERANYEYRPRNP